MRFYEKRLEKGWESILTVLFFSFEEKAKKSEDVFWQNLQKKIDFSKVELFVDDKEENIKLAEKYGIPWFVYEASKWVQSIISEMSGN